MKLPLISKKVLSIDFGSKEIKIVEGKYSNNNLSISKHFSIDVPENTYSDGEILNRDLLVNRMKESLKENKIRTNTAYGIINSSSIITREVSIPKVPEKDIPSVIEYQLDDFFPINPEEYVINSLILGDFMDGQVEKTNILLVGIPKPMVLSHLELMKDIGLEPEILDFQGNVVAKLLHLNNQVNGFYKTRDLSIASLDIGYTNSKLTITKNGKIEVARVIDLGGKTLYHNIQSFFDYSQDEIESRIMEIENLNVAEDDFSDHNRIVNIVKSTMDTLAENMELIYRYYLTRESGNSINYIVLQGGYSNINGVDSLLSNYFNMPAVHLENLDKLKWNGDLTRYSNAIGGLIRIKEVKR